MLNCAESELGGIDILVNNAGVCPVKPLLETTLAEWETTIGINATGTFLCSTFTARRMIARGIRGAMVNIASSSGKEGWPNFGAYTASKFAVVGFTQTFAREMAPYGIRVNAICPGKIDAGVSEEITAELAARYGATPSAAAGLIITCAGGSLWHPGRCGPGSSVSDLTGGLLHHRPGHQRLRRHGGQPLKE